MGFAAAAYALNLTNSRPKSLVFALFRVEQSYNIHTVLYLRSGARVWESSLSQGHLVGDEAILVGKRGGTGVRFP